MKVLGIPGSLEILLQPVQEIAERRQLFPHDFETLLRQGDVGHYLAKIKRIYRQGLAKKPYNRLIEQGVKAEYYLASELRRELHAIEGYLFNNFSIDIRDDQVKGVGLSSFPDHLLITRNSFMYIETKNWSWEYLVIDENEKKAEITQQVEMTQKHLAHFLQEQGIKARPEVLVYDHQRTLGERIGKVKVAGDVGEIVQMVRNSHDSVPEYQKMVDVLKRVGA